MGTVIESANFSGTPYVTKHAYIRVFIGSLLPDYNTAIYIDPDTIILRDISPILNYKSKSPFSAVLETVNSGKLVFNNEDFPYFSSGVFVADLDFWRKENIEGKILNWINENPNSTYAEQDSLNAILSEYMSPLPFSFNFFEWIVDNNLLMAKEYDNPLIVHFVGADKPWGEKVVSEYSLAWRKYYGLLG
jgi:lipopolysaccharide biosynthesis glycosyltransferase